MAKQAVRFITITVIMMLLAAALTVPPIAADGQSDSGIEQLFDPQDPGEPATKVYPNLDSALAQLIVEGKANGPGHARTLAIQLGIAVSGEENGVRVIIESDPAATAETTEAGEALGAVVEATYQNLVQATVPLTALEALANTPGVRFVERPVSPVPETVTSEGVGVIGADAWQSAGLRGAGVKVAVVDSGFSGYASLLGTELPASVTAHPSPSIGMGASPHGTACAEIVYDIAPDAQLYLVNVWTEVELANAVDWLIAQGVNVISHSMGWFNLGPGDGTGFVDYIVDNARSHGILWVNAAGNYAQAHWSGTWTDGDSDNWLNYSGAYEGNGFWANSGDIVAAFLRWNDTWSGSANDYNLHLFRADDPPTLVAQAVSVQNGTQKPTEDLFYAVTTSDYYFLSIRRSSAPSTSFVFDLFVPGYLIDYGVASGSIAIPADSPNALAVGAVAWNATSTIEYYSSQGPTRNGAIKPDLVAPSRVSTASYGTYQSTNWGFAGTSAAAPHVAGAAALVKQKYPGYTPAQIQSLLEGQAVGLGASGKDNVFGSGRLQLGSAYEVPVADFHANATTVQAGTAITFTDDSTNSPTSWAWDFDNNGSTDSTAQNPSNTYTVAGSYSVKLTAANSVGSDEEVKNSYITVNPGALHHITVSPLNPSVEAGGSQTFTAQSYDQYNNLRTGDAFTWSVTNPVAGTINPSTGAFTAGTVAGTYANAIRATSGAIVGTASVTISTGALHHISVSPPNQTIQAGGNQTFTAAGYDQYDNLRTGDTFTWSVTDPAAGSINASTGAFTAGTTPGVYNEVVRAASGPVAGTASVTVTSGPLHHIIVSPPSVTLGVSESQTFTAAGFDQFDNAIDALTFTWSVTDAAAGSINASTGAFTAGGTLGSYVNVIQAASGAVTGMASVTVTAGPLHHIAVVPANPSVQPGEDRTFVAYGYDQYNNLRTGDVFAWSVTNPTAGSIDASAGMFTAGTTPGVYYDVIQATSGLISGTASVTVTPGPLHHVTVSPASPSVQVGGNQAFTAAGYDQFNNARSGDVFAWSVTDPLAGSIDPDTGMFTAGSTPGSYANVVQAGSADVTGTASVTVTAGPLHHIAVSPAGPTVAVNGSQAFTAAGYDAFDNLIAGLTFSWSVSNSTAGSIDASTGIFTAGTTARAYNSVVQATSNGVTGATSVVVTPGPLDHIQVSPSNPCVPMSGERTYAATGHDLYDNIISGLTFTWSLGDDDAGSIDPSTGTLTAGIITGVFTGVVAATSGEVSGSASVQVIDGNVLNGSVTLQGGSRPAAARVVQVTVRLFTPGAPDVVNGTPLATFVATTEDPGSSTVIFQVTGEELIPGAYDVTIKGPHTLANVIRDVDIAAGTTSLDFGMLLEGNANDDGIINALDFSILASSYLKTSGQPGYDVRVDFDCTGAVNALDFSLLAGNYLKTSPREAP